MSKEPFRFHISPTQTIALGFLLMILLGASLLSLPVSSNSGTWTNFFDCLFTATSASCVTGLVVVDTSIHWSLFGQIVLIILIQIGGLGFMTVSTLFLLPLNRRLGMRQRDVLVESINYSQVGNILPLVKKILFGTVAFELTGAVLLSFRFVPMLGWGKGIFYSIFHSISAFCNAGFDLMGTISGPYSSLTSFSGDWLVTLTVSGLILVGGVGFLVWDDLWEKHFRFKRLSLHSKLVLTVSAILLIGGTVLFRIFEANNLCEGLPEGEKWLTSFFDAVTPRTAGFNTTDTASLSNSSILLTYFLMFIGGGSGSTAGGMKMTTVAVLFLFAFSGMRNTHEAVAFGRQIKPEVFKKAIYVITANFGMAITGACIICAIDPLGIRDVLFETISAVSTVGMTIGITRDLSAVSRIVIIFLMYCGRVGTVSFALAVMQSNSRAQVTHPSENVIVG